MENSPPSLGGWMMSLPATGGRLRSLPIRCRSLRGKQNDLAGPSDEVLVLTLDPHVKARPRRRSDRESGGTPARAAGAQCSGATRAAMHHGAKNSACRNTPPVRCATLKTSDNASMPPFLPGSGVSVMSPGGPVIDHDGPPHLHDDRDQHEPACSRFTMRHRPRTARRGDGTHECDQRKRSPTAIDMPGAFSASSECAGTSTRT